VGARPRRIYTDRVSKNKRLKLVDPEATRLGRPTIMDRALAQRYGAPYVHLAAFAIDVDRVHRHTPESQALPFAWEVFLTELRIVRLLDEVTSDPTLMLEEVCLQIMDLPGRQPDPQGVLGAQLPFAVYTSVAHGHLPARLGHCFGAWKKPPTELIDAVARQFASEGLGARLAQHCLNAVLDPPLTPPVRSELAAIATPAV
jgi:hypothetical protein